MKRILVVALAVSLAPLAACSKKKEGPAQSPAPSAAASPAAPAAPLDIQGRRIDISVKNAGYEPESVDVKAGEQVTLVFTMKEQTECGSEVVIPSVNVSKKLKLNEPQAIPFKAETTGPVKFACGMNMMQGKIIVN